MPLQNCVDIRDCAFGVADRCGDPAFQEEGTEGVFQLPEDHTPHHPREGLLQGAGEESAAAS